MRNTLSVAIVAVVLTSACHRSGQPVVGTGPTATANAMPPGVTRAMIAQGDTIFNTKSCVKCHLQNGVGGSRAPNLTDQVWIHIDGSYDAIVGLVTTGFTKAQQKDPKYQFTMNPRGGMKFTDDEIKAVAAYVWSLSHPVK